MLKKAVVDTGAATLHTVYMFGFNFASEDGLGKVTNKRLESIE